MPISEVGCVLGNGVGVDWESVFLCSCVENDVLLVAVAMALSPWALLRWAVLLYARLPWIRSHVGVTLSSSSTVLTCCFLKSEGDGLHGVLPGESGLSASGGTVGMVGRVSGRLGVVSC